MEGETEPLLGHYNDNVENTQNSQSGSKKKNAFCILVFLIGVTALSAAIIISYFLYFKYVIGLNVMALNVWGMPAKVGALDKELRMKAIGKFIQKKEYDVYLLAELWMRPDHETIRSLLPKGYHMSKVGDFALSTCDGRVLPSFCSGLAIVSRFPFLEKEFLEFSYHGSIWNPDGEYWARKGAGRARIEPHPGFIVDMFVTHTCAVGPNYTNAYYREHQVQELVGWASKSNADFVILGGDFNTDPKDNETSYHNLKEAMISSMEEFFLDIKEWLIPSKATYANPKNTYSYMYQPVLYDYIWHKANGRNMIWTNFFQVPFLKTWKLFSENSTEVVNSTKETEISFSDHEAVTSRLFLWKSIF